MENHETPLTDPEFFQGVRRMMRQCEAKANKHDLAFIAINACIDHGIDTGGRIVRALSTLGFNRQHIGMTLNRGTGDDPKRHHWRRDEKGRLTVHSFAGLSAAHICIPT